jgi:small subunit ribosomal protein S4
VDKDNLKGKVVALPAREELTMPINEQIIVEFYSK